MLVTVLLTFIQAVAYDFEYEGLYYEALSTTDRTCALVDGDEPYVGSLTIPDVAIFKGIELKVIEIKGTLKDVSHITFGKNVETLASGCFKDGIIEEIVIPETVHKIAGAFTNSALKKVTINGNIETGSSAFGNCVKLEQVQWADSMYLDSYMFSGCSNLKELSFGKLQTTIPRCAFRYCKSLKFDFSNIKVIESEAFSNCTSLGTINLASITEIGDCAFENCGDLDLVIIGNTIDKIRSSDYYPLNADCKGAWYGCSIDSLHISDSTTELILENINTHWSTDPLEWKYQPYFTNTKLNKVYLGRNVSGTKNNTFCYTNLAHIRIGPLVDNLDRLGRRGFFQFCEDLEEVIFDEGSHLKEIDIDTFWECKKLRSIKLPDSVTQIHQEAFKNCESLRNITLGSQLQFIGSSCFNGCESLELITLYTPVPPECKHKFERDIYLNASLRVPMGCKQIYSETEPWLNFWDIEEDPNIIPVVPAPDPIEITMEDKTLLLNADFESDSPITWTSSDESIAIVDTNGTVKAIHDGEVQVIAENEAGEIKIWDVTIKLKPVVIELTLDDCEIQLTTDFVTDSEITWTSDDDEIATVDKNGLVTAISDGQVTITASNVAGESMQWKITVIFEFSSSMSIDTIRTEEVIVVGNNIIVTSNAEVFDLSGRRVGCENLAHGSYIVRFASGKSLKVLVK